MTIAESAMKIKINRIELRIMSFSNLSKFKLHNGKEHWRK